VPLAAEVLFPGWLLSPSIAALVMSLSSMTLTYRRGNADRSV
jgi:hypothetical protein